MAIMTLDVMALTELAQVGYTQFTPYAVVVVRAHAPDVDRAEVTMQLKACRMEAI